MIIIGAGMAGLLAANILHHRKPTIYEQQTSIPNNHSAVLRFRTGTIGEVLGIPFRRVRMMKCTVPFYGNPVADMFSYAYKNTGSIRSDRSLPIDPVTDDRWVAPNDMISKMAENVRICLGMKVSYASGHIIGEAMSIPITKGEPTISTIPMPVLMSMLDYPYRHDINFEYQAGSNLRAKIKDCDAYVSLYFPDPTAPFSRVSITGNDLIVEGRPNLNPERVLPDVHQHLGIAPDMIHDVEVVPQSFSKINPIDDHTRKEFIYWASSEHNIFSLGRFATWRPGLLLDDLLNDIRMIDKWMQSGRYAMKQAQSR